jgi:hypothetical protein
VNENSVEMPERTFFYACCRERAGERETEDNKEREMEKR